MKLATSKRYADIDRNSSKHRQPKKGPAKAFSRDQSPVSQISQRSLAAISTRDARHSMHRNQTYQLNNTCSTIDLRKSFMDVTSKVENSRNVRQMKSPNAALHRKEHVSSFTKVPAKQRAMKENSAPFCTQSATIETLMARIRSLESQLHDMTVKYQESQQEVHACRELINLKDMLI